MGSLLLGWYATQGVNADGPEGGVAQLVVQAIGVGVAAAWSGAGTWLVMSATECVMATRIDTDEEVKGLDNSQHGEASYHNLQALL